MKAKRRRLDPEFKARVALEALKDIQTLQQIAKEFDIHPVQLSSLRFMQGRGGSDPPQCPSWRGRPQGDLGEGQTEKIVR